MLTISSFVQNSDTSNCPITTTVVTNTDGSAVGSGLVVDLGADTITILTTSVYLYQIKI